MVCVSLSALKGCESNVYVNIFQTLKVATNEKNYLALNSMYEDSAWKL